MTSERFDRAESWFHELAALDGNGRATRLRDLARTDAALAADVASLLEAHDADGGPFDRAAGRYVRASSAAGGSGAEPPAGPAPDPPAGDTSGERIGPWRIISELGRGGMSTVYLAERADEQFRRRVALKIIRPGPDAAMLDARFRLERQLLASLDHPNIARLLDAGRAPDGRPYLVMEYVRGAPIDEYCDRHRLPIEARMRLVVKVLDAVALAHRSLVVHRDLKPGNILVDDDGSPKLLDFGIAKLLAGPFADAGRPLTRQGQLPLTPEYASPEQLRGMLLTTASDVYALGVLLYELLCGHTPYAAGGVSRQGLVEAVVAGNVTPPSRRVTDPDGFVALRGRRRAALPGLVAAARSITPDMLVRRLTGDVDAIVQKALHEDARERYVSAEDLRRDLERYRRGLPVEARPPGRAYRATKFLLRHRTETAAAVIVVASLVGGSAVAVWQAAEARAERDLAQTARVRAESALHHAQAVSAALADLFETGDPWLSRPVDVEASRSLVALGLARVEALADLPLVQADLLSVLARVRARLGDVAEADSLAERALALREQTGTAGDVAAVASLNSMALVRRLQGRISESAALARRALSLQEEQLGEDHADIPETLTVLARAVPAAEAEKLHDRAIRILRAAHGSTHPSVADALTNLGQVRRTLGRPEDAAAALREALAIRRAALGPVHPNVAVTMVHLADISSQFAGDRRSAEDLYRRALDIQRRALGDDHPALTHAIESLAGVRSDEGDHREAEALLREGLEIRRRVFGADSEAAAVGLGALGRELMRQRRFGDAEQTYREALSLVTASGTPETWNWPVTGAQTDLASVLVELGRFDEAERLFEQALRIRERIRGANHSGYALVLGSLGSLNARRGELDRAVSLYRQALDILLAGTTARHPDVRRLHGELADVHAARGDAEAARRYYELAGGG